jgi:hypothetical protein
MYNWEGREVLNFRDPPVVGEGKKRTEERGRLIIS